MSAERLRRALPVAAVVVLAVVLAALAPREESGLPLDPRSTGPAGTRALVDLLEALGARAEVVERVPTDGQGSLLVGVDALDAAERRRVRHFARAGGTVVLLDRFSPLAPPPARPFDELFSEPLVRGCREPALVGVESLAVDAVAFAVPEGSQGCFVDPDAEDDVDEAWLVITPVGAGRIVAVGGSAPFRNAELDTDDHALLAVTLLAPREDARVRALTVELAADGGGRSLLQLLPPSTWAAGAGLLIAFLLLVAWRARRLGRPVQESTLVALPASGLVTAAGRLLQRAGARARAGEVLRGDLRRTLRRRLAAPSTAGDAELARLTAAHTGAPARQTESLLAGSVPASDAELVELASAVERLRAELVGAAHGRPEGAE